MQPTNECKVSPCNVRVENLQVGVYCISTPTMDSVVICRPSLMSKRSRRCVHSNLYCIIIAWLQCGDNWSEQHSSIPDLMCIFLICCMRR